MTASNRENLLDFQEVSQTFPLSPAALPATPEPAPQSGHIELQSSFGNAFLAAAGAGGLPPDNRQAHSLQFGLGNAAVSRKLIQRKPDNGDAGGSNSVSPTGSAGTPATASTGMIVDDTAETVGPGQMKKSAFLGQLRAAVDNTVAEVSAGLPLSAAVNPEIERRFAQAHGQSGGQLEQTIRSQVPGAAGAPTAAGLIPPIIARVRQAVEQSVPPGLSGAAAVLGSVVNAATNVVKEIAGAVSSVASGIVAGAGSAISALGSLLFKTRNGGPAENSQDPEAIQTQLSAGHSLEPGVKSRMESAYGQSFSGVEVHSDANAGSLSENLNARAFTVGQHIAFGAGEYQPGTLIGDALIAHELAHVVQQRNGPTAEGPAQKGAAEPSGAEEDADRAAVGAMVSSWGGAKRGLTNVASSALPQLKSGLRLQRCSTDKPPEQTFLPMSPVEVEALQRMRQNIAAAEELLKDPTLADEDREAIQAAIRSARGSLGSYQELREQGEARTAAMSPIVIASTAIVADDATGVGVADDPLLILTGIAAIVTIIVTNPPAPDLEIGRQWLNVGRAIESLGTAITTVLMAQKVGEQVRGLAEVLAVHLARLLGEAVGGRPPDEPNDPNNFKHWWKEIKAFLKGIKDKGLTSKQLLRELRKKFSEAEIESIKQAIRRAAEKMGENPPDFL